MSNIFFTADHHFGHANIIKFTNRPFDSVEAMDEFLVDCWNLVVGDDDTVYHLGDFTLGGDAAKYISAIKGKIKFIANEWHHDRRWLRTISPGQKSRSGHVIELLPPLYVKEIEGRKIVMCHFPFESWDSAHYGSIHLHGHSHGKMRHVPNRIDVGVDATLTFMPVRINYIIEHNKHNPE